MLVFFIVILSILMFILFRRPTFLEPSGWPRFILLRIRLLLIFIFPLSIWFAGFSLFKLFHFLIIVRIPSAFSQ